MPQHATPNPGSDRRLDRPRPRREQPGPRAQPAARRLDTRAPLVLDTRELGRRAGSLRRARLTVPAPPAMGTPVIGVPPGAEVELDLRLEAVMEGVLVSGLARVPLAGECGRCLDPVDGTLDVDLQQLYVYPDASAAVVDDDDEVGEIVEDRLDLEPALRDAVVLALPLSPRCRDDCPGLCPTCGSRLAEVPADHSHETADPRWARLAGLRDEGESDHQIGNQSGQRIGQRIGQHGPGDDMGPAGGVAGRHTDAHAVQSESPIPDDLEN